MGSKQRYDLLDELWVAGEWEAGTGERYTNLSPWTREPIFEARVATTQDVDRAVQAAKEAQTKWVAMPPAVRSQKMAAVGQLIEERADEIADWIVREVGGTKLKARLELQLVQGVFQSAATLPYQVEGRILPEDIPGKESRSYRAPVGVVGLISPWNFPLQLTARTLAPALAVGNAVVIKPALDSWVTGGTIFAALLSEVGIPKGLVSVLPGPGSEIGDALVRHPGVDLVSFTGSTPVGRAISKAVADSDRIKPLELELGGNSPIVVLDDADIDQAVEASVWGKFVHSGQICMIANRIIVEDAIYDDFVDAYVDRVSQLAVASEADDDAFVGPLINESQFDQVMQLIAAAKEEGATCRIGGDPNGFIIPPHVFADVAADSVLCRNEIFGPVAPIVRADDEDHALELANDTDLGLSSAVFTRDVQRGLNFARKVEAGMTHINDQTVNDSPSAPFGGEKNSGIGRFNGEWAVRAFTSDQWITIQHERRQFPFSVEDFAS